MPKQHTNPKVIVAAATGYSTAPDCITFYGPMGHITLMDDGKFVIGGWASCSVDGGYKCTRSLEFFQNLYRGHPALTGKPLPKPTEVVEMVKIDCPEGENFGDRTVTTSTNWLGVVTVYNHGHNAGGTWVDAWVG